MKKIFTIVLISLILSSIFAGATNVSGPITTNTTWTLAGSPYIVTSYVTVNSGVTLTVQTGVTVKFYDNQYMLVYGTMNATGATFTANNASPTPGIWSYIQVGNSTYSGTVTMSSCQVQYANTFAIQKGKATLTGTDLLNFNSHGVDIQQTGCRFKMTGGNVNTTSTNAANNCYGIGGFQSSTDTISGVTIQHFKYGLYLKQHSKFDVTNTTITSCTWPIWYEGSADLYLHGTNSFTGNTNSQVYLGFTSMADTMTLPTISLAYNLPSTLTVAHTGMLVIQTGGNFKMGSGVSLNTQVSGLNFKRDLSIFMRLSEGISLPFLFQKFQLSIYSKYFHQA